MPLPTTNPLGSTTAAAKWKLDVDVSASTVPDWRRLMGCTDSTANPGTVAMEDDADYDGDGAGSSSAVGIDWGYTATVRRAPGRATPLIYDPAQEFLRIKGRRKGTQNSAHVRFYEFDPNGGPTVEAYEGYAAVAWANGGGGPRALSTSTITLTGQGALLEIPHPSGTGAPVPVITGFAPGTFPVAGGSVGAIIGGGFTGATALTIGGTAVPAANWSVLDAGRISLVIPARTAGNQPVIVTTPGGTSAPVNVLYA